MQNRKLYLKFILISLLSIFPKFVLGVLTTPTLNTPADNAVNLPTGVQMSVNSTGSTNYAFEYSEFASMANALRIESLYSSYNVYAWATKLKLNTTYYWRVKAIKTTDSSNWTAVRKFTTSADFQKYSPSNSGFTLNTSAMYFSWYRIASFDTFEFQLDTVSSFNSNFLNSEIIPDTFQTFGGEIFQPNLLFGTTYYWRARARQGSSVTNWTSVGNLTTFDSIVIKAPLNSVTQNVSIVFDWTIGASTHPFQVLMDTSTSFNSSLRLDTIAVDGLRKFETDPFMLSELLYEKHYYFKVRPINAADSGKWSYGEFTTKGFANDFVSSSGFVNPISTFEVYRKIDGSSGYQIQLDLSSTFSGTDQRNSFSTSGTVTFDSLKFNGIYYTRSRPYHAKDTGVWSKVRTAKVLPFPTRHYPYNNYTDIGIKDSMTFDNTPGIKGYQIQVADTNYFEGSLIIDKIADVMPAYKDTFINGHTFKFNTDYYWRIRGWHETDTSQWSGGQKFTTIGAPLQKLPYNSNFLGTDATTKLDWEDIPNVSTYQIRLDTTIDFNSALAFDSIITNQSYLDFSNLYFDQLYYWSVRSIHQNDTSEWSPTWVFKVFNIRPTYPKNNATNISLTSIDWASIKGTNGYILQLDTNENFNNPLEFSDQKADPFFHFFNEIPERIGFDTKCFWRVKVHHVKDTTDWSSTWNFTTKPRIAMPLLTPANEATDVSYNVAFSWGPQSAASSYALEYAKNADFSNATKLSSTTTSSTAKLDLNTTYYWHVRARNSAGDEVNDWSETWSFTTEESVTGPSLISPENEEKDVKLDTRMRWAKVTGATSYEGEISTSPSFNTKFNHSSPTNSYLFSEMEYNTTYYWRARANLGGFYSEWSEVWTFTTDKDRSSVLTLEVINVDVYPSPTSGMFTIDFSNSDFTPFTITNVLGEEVFEIRAASNRSKLFLDISDLPSGVYFIKFRNGESLISSRILKE